MKLGKHLNEKYTMKMSKIITIKKKKLTKIKNVS